MKLLEKLGPFLSIILILAICGVMILFGEAMG